MGKILFEYRCGRANGLGWALTHPLFAGIELHITKCMNNSLYINYLPKCLDNLTSPHLYTDNTQILISANSIDERTENLNSDLKQTWLVT